MKVTKEQLKKIIKEELAQVINESSRSAKNLVIKRVRELIKDFSELRLDKKTYSGPTHKTSGDVESGRWRVSIELGDGSLYDITINSDDKRGMIWIDPGNNADDWFPKNENYPMFPHKAIVGDDGAAIQKKLYQMFSDISKMAGRNL